MFIEQKKDQKILKVMINETIITAMVTIVATLFGKEFWDFWKNRDTIKVQVDLQQKITRLEKMLIKSNTAVNMLLTYLESKYKDDSQDHDIIEKVRTYLSEEKKESTEKSIKH